MRVVRRIERLWNQAGGSLLTQWMAKYGYVPIVLIGVAGLALEIGTGEWQGGETVVAKTPVVVRLPLWPRLLLSPSLLLWPTVYC